MTVVEVREVAELLPLRNLHFKTAAAVLRAIPTHPSCDSDLFNKLEPGRHFVSPSEALKVVL